MGTVPIFERLRREKIPGARPGILSGTLTILPDTALPALNGLAQAEACAVSTKSIQGTSFSLVDFAGGNKKKVRIVTALFSRGEINIMVGTKSLLGDNKQHAEMFRAQLTRQLGDIDVIYTQNAAGHVIYRKCVMHSFVNQEINDVGVIVRKEMF